VTAYRQLLAIEGVPRLLLSSLLARLPLGMGNLAILLMFRTTTGSFATAGVAVGALALAGAVTAPVLGTLVDRYGQTRVLLTAAFGQATLLVALVVGVIAHLPVALLIGLTAGAGALVPPVSACVRSLWSHIFYDSVAREAAYAVDATSQEVIWTVGPLLVALLVSLFAPTITVLVSAGIAVAGTLVFASSPASRQWRAEERTTTRRTTALTSPGLKSLLITVALTGMAIGAVEVGLPALAVSVASSGMSGVLIAVWCLGSMAGGLSYGIRLWPSTVPRRYGILLAAMGLFTVPLMAVNTLFPALALTFLAGLPQAPAFSCQFTIAGGLARPGTTTEAFTWNTAAIVAGVAAGSALGGALADAYSPAAAFALGSVAGVLAALFALARRNVLQPAPALTP
jgi:predicted MFS family arabinose efflux permease